MAHTGGPEAVASEEYAMSGSRTRVSVFLPIQMDSDVRAALAVLRHLQGRLKADPPIEGYTSSRLQPPVYLGAWYDETATPAPEWCEEAVVHVVLDYSADLAGHKGLQRELFVLRERASEIYTQYGRPQKEFWIMVHPIVQVVRVPPAA